MSLLFWRSVFFLSTLPAFAASNEGHSAGPVHLNWFETITSSLGWGGEFPVFLCASIFTLLVLVLTGLVYSAHVKKTISENQIYPEKKANFVFFVESSMDFVYSTAKEQLGHHYRDFIPYLSGLFLYIFISNLLGLIPGLPPITENFSANLAIGLICFVFYNFYGLREHGASYIKQFMGPFLVLAPLFLCLEFISHVARPLSLAFRLSANIYGDHLVLAAFSSMAPVVVPALLSLFGLLVACIQSFVFTVLTTIYISMAISHDH